MGKSNFIVLTMVYYFLNVHINEDHFLWSVSTCNIYILLFLPSFGDIA